VTGRELAVFAGPSLACSPLTRPLGSRLLPPVRGGDLRSVTAALPPGSRILIIDGEFWQTQSVPLTEIRDAIDAGFELYGAASMGALRAVEAAPLGMTGIGQVWAEYASGRLVADDEVALTYDPESYTPFTVPLVNVRRLAALLVDSDTPGAAVTRMLRAASAVHFRDRTFEVLGQIVGDELPSDPAANARLLLEPRMRKLWDVKMADAEGAVALLISGLISGLVPGSPRSQSAVAAPVPPRPHFLLDPIAGIAWNKSAST
jgi:hypothetical protein